MLSPEWSFQQLRRRTLESIELVQSSLETDSNNQVDISCNSTLPLGAETFQEDMLMETFVHGGDNCAHVDKESTSLIGVGQYHH